MKPTTIFIVALALCLCLAIPAMAVPNQRNQVDYTVSLSLVPDHTVKLAEYSYRIRDEMWSSWYSTPTAAYIAAGPANQTHRNVTLTYKKMWMFLYATNSGKKVASVPYNLALNLSLDQNQVDWTIHRTLNPWNEVNYLGTITAFPRRTTTVIREGPVAMTSITSQQFMPPNGFPTEPVTRTYPATVKKI